MPDVYEMYKFYTENKDFKRYIDECVKTYGGDKYAMFENKIAQEYYKSLLVGGCNSGEKKCSV